MADRYYRLNLGQKLQSDVIKSAAATPGAFVDVRVTFDAPFANKTEIFNALRAIENFIEKDNWPPA